MRKIIYFFFEVNKVYLIKKCIKIIFYYYFLKIIFDIRTSKWSENTKKNLFKIKKIKNFQIFLKHKNRQNIIFKKILNQLPETMKSAYAYIQMIFQNFDEK
jgi:hypothetical protein